MLTLGSCVALNLSYSGCCNFRLSPPCSINGCFCDDICHTSNDCCNDKDDIECHPATSFSPTPTALDKNQMIFHYISPAIINS